MPAKYRVAAIGRTGKGNYGHGLDTVWLKCDRAEIVAVADENEAGRAADAKRLGATRKPQVWPKEKRRSLPTASKMWHTPWRMG